MKRNMLEAYAAMIIFTLIFVGYGIFVFIAEMHMFSHFIRSMN